MPTLRLFVYGTLRDGSDTPPARWLARRVRFVRAASVRGRLFAIRTRGGTYPALTMTRGGGQVRGTVCDVAMGPGDLARLDRYEGRDYRRRPMRALIERSPGGATWMTTQVYVWRARLPPGSRRIAGGDFLRWLLQSGERPYTSRGDPGARRAAGIGR